MIRPINILVLEDSAEDFELIKIELKKASFDHTVHQATDKDSFKAFMSQEHPDVILSDYNIPGYDIMQALDLLKQHAFQGPFILVTGALMDEEAVDLIVHHDVDDYIFKDNLSKLNSAISREIEKEHMEQELLEKNQELEKLSLVASHTHNGVIITDAQGRIEWVNSAYNRLTGYTNEEMKGKKPGHFLQGAETDPDTIKRINEKLEQAIPFSEDILNYRKDGSKYWIKLDVTPIFDQSGEVQQFVGIQEEITDKKELENILKDSLNQVFIVDADTLKIEYCNQRAIDSIQYSEEELKEMTPLHFELALNEAEYQSILQKVQENGSYSFETTHTRKDGTTYEAYCEIRPDFYHGKSVYVIDVLDVTEVVKARAQLSKAQKFNELAVEGAGVGLWEVDLQTFDTFYNDMYYKMLGYDLKDVSDSFNFYKSIVHPEDDKYIEGIYEQIFAKEAHGFELKARLMAKSGEYRWVYSKSQVIEYDEEGNPLKLAGSNIDITDLEKAMQEKDTLIQEVHHRVKNNLAIISGLIELQIMKEDAGGRKQLLEANNRIHAIAAVHHQLYNTDSFSEINVQDYFEELIYKTKSSIIDPEQEIEIRFQNTLDQININQAVPIGLLINELITNSIKHAFPEGSGYIHIQVSEEEDNQVLFSYRDSGKGFRKDFIHGFGLEIIETLISQLSDDYHLETDGKYELKFRFQNKYKGAHSNLS